MSCTHGSRSRSVIESLERRALLSGVVPAADFGVSATPLDGLRGRAVGTDAAGNSVVTFTEPDGHGSGVYFRRFDAAGTVLGPAVRVHAQTPYHQSRPSLDVAPDGTFCVAWFHEGAKAGSSLWDVYARRYAADGSPLTGEVRVTDAKAGQTNYDPTIATDERGNFVVAWKGSLGKGQALYSRRYGAGGEALAAASVVDQGPGASAPFVDADADGDFVVAYQAAGADGSADAFARRFDRAGVAVGGRFTLSAATAGAQQSPRVEMTAAGGFVAAWAGDGLGGSGIHGRRFDPSGAPAGGEVRLSDLAEAVQTSPALDVRDDGTFVTCWYQHNPTGGPTVHARQFDGSAAPAPLGAGIAVDAWAAGVRYAPVGAIQVAARSDGGFVAAWQRTDRESGDDVLWGRVYVADGSTLDGTSG